MARRKTVEDIDEFRKLALNKKLAIGTERTVKLLLSGKLNKVFLSSNCPENIKAVLRHCCKISGVELQETGKTNEQLGEACRKPFSISVMGVLS